MSCWVIRRGKDVDEIFTATRNSAAIAPAAKHKRRFRRALNFCKRVNGRSLRGRTFACQVVAFRRVRGLARLRGPLVGDRLELL